MVTGMGGFRPRWPLQVRPSSGHSSGYCSYSHQATSLSPFCLVTLASDFFASSLFPFSSNLCLELLGGRPNLC